MICVFRYLCVTVYSAIQFSVFELQVCLINSVQFSSVQERKDWWVKVKPSVKTCNYKL